QLPKRNRLQGKAPDLNATPPWRQTNAIRGKRAASSVKLSENNHWRCCANRSARFRVSRGFFVWPVRRLERWLIRPRAALAFVLSATMYCDCDMCH
ncbi:empty spiracle, partial [Danaus plexippus plexippus]